MVTLLAAIALAAPDPELPDGSETAETPAPPPEVHVGRRTLVGAHLGVTESAGSLGVAPWPRIEAGFSPAGGRVDLLAEIGFTVALAKDGGADPQRYSYTTTVTDLRLGAGPVVRLARPGEAIAPEVGLSPELHLLHVGVATQVRGVDGGRVGETLVRPGGVARFGVAAAVGQGEIPVDVVLDVVPLGGDLAGSVTNVAFGVSIGWRVPVRRERG